MRRKPINSSPPRLTQSLAAYRIRLRNCKTRNSMRMLLLLGTRQSQTQNMQICSTKPYYWSQNCNFTRRLEVRADPRRPAQTPRRAHAPHAADTSIRQVKHILWRSKWPSLSRAALGRCLIPCKHAVIIGIGKVRASSPQRGGRVPRCTHLTKVASTDEDEGVTMHTHRAQAP